jgi:hypothetical protein
VATVGEYEQDGNVGFTLDYTDAYGNTKSKAFPRASVICWDISRVRSASGNFCGTRLRIVVPLPANVPGLETDTFQDWLITLTVQGDHFQRIKTICVKTFGRNGLGPRRPKVRGPV